MVTSTFFRALAVAAVAALSDAVVEAADQLVFGTRLLIQNPPAGATDNRAVHLARDAAITLGVPGSAGDPRCTGAGGGGMSSLRIVASGSAGDITIPLPCSGWTANVTNTIYGYADRSGGTCRRVLVKNGVFTKAVCKGTQVVIDVNATMSPVAVVTTLNAERYCTLFGGTGGQDGSDQQTFLRRAAAPPVGCPPPTISCVFAATWDAGYGSLFDPVGVAIDGSGNVYVSQYAANLVQKFTGDGTFITHWGSPGAGAGQFNRPLGIAVSLGGDVYVADLYNHRIQQFTSGGAFVTQWGSQGAGDGQFNYPYAVAVGPSGDVYVVDEGNYRIQEFTSSGAFVTQWGSFGSGDGQFMGSTGIAVDGSGRVYVADFSSFRVEKFTGAGSFVTSWGTLGTGDGQFGPWGIAVDGGGAVYVADQYNSRIQKFLGDGTFVTKWGSLGVAPGQLNEPHGLAVDPNGDVYVADRSNDRIEKFDCP